MATATIEVATLGGNPRVREGAFSYVRVGVEEVEPERHPDRVQGLGAGQPVAFLHS